MSKKLDGIVMQKTVNYRYGKNKVEKLVEAAFLCKLNILFK